ncbi:MAG TPA: cytochrome c biogenesis protein ResB [Candidatus Eremiobacteraceae bacterium]|nr:cytochrome c biogenesis protein ResB [Candidatus Eremiobacteraceae bacterium]
MSRTTPAPAVPRFVDEILDVLSNVLFPVVVFLVWAVATTIGTIVEQNQDPQTYYDTYPSAVANLILRLHLDTILHSAPYFTLIVLLLVSMTVCTFRRVIPKRFPKDRAVPIDHFGLHADVKLDDAADAARATREYLAARGFACRSQRIDGDDWLFGDKHRWARYGVLVAHLGFAVIATGVFLGWIAGFKGQLQIFDGETVSVPQQAGLSVHLTKFTAAFEPVQTPNGVFYQASKFESDVIVDEAGAATQASIIVNHPLTTAHHVYFYQASYGFGGQVAIAHDGRPVHLGGTGRLMPQDEILLPGTSREVEYLTLLGPSDPSQVPVGVPLPKTDEYAMWLIHDNVPTTDRPLLVPVGATVDLGDGYTLHALPPIAWSGLTYRDDPGEGFVGAGALILVAGFVMALFFVPVKVYARVRQEGRTAGIAIAATTTKGNAIYEDEFKRLVSGLTRIAAPAAGTSGRTEEAYA